MSTYDKSTFTYGYEIEWGDIRRDLDIPEHLGSWEYSETDIINLQPPYQYVASDPLGIDPPVGGEVNTKPTKTWEDQVARIGEIKQFFVDNGCPPTVCCTTHGHLHVHVPGLTEDIDALKRLIKYIKENQQQTVEHCLPYYDDQYMKGLKGAKMYMKYDGGRLMPDYMSDNIINMAKDFDHFIKLHAAGKDGVSMGRPFRYAINTYCLKHTNTIEFRCFRATTDLNKIRDQFRFVEMFIDAALNDGPSVFEIISENDFDFPEYYFDRDEYVGLLKTRYDKSRGKKKRSFHEAT